MVHLDILRLALSEHHRTPSLKGVKLSPSFVSEPELPGSRRLFHPLGKIRVFWDLCGLFLLIVDTILLPLSLAFNWGSDTQDAGSLFLFLDFVISVGFWTIDIFMNLGCVFGTFLNIPSFLIRETIHE